MKEERENLSSMIVHAALASWLFFPPQAVGVTYSHRMLSFQSTTSATGRTASFKVACHRGNLQSLSSASVFHEKRLGKNFSVHILIYTYMLYIRIYYTYLNFLPFLKSELADNAR